MLATAVKWRCSEGVMLGVMVCEEDLKGLGYVSCISAVNCALVIVSRHHCLNRHLTVIAIARVRDTAYLFNLHHTFDMWLP